MLCGHYTEAFHPVNSSWPSVLLQAFARHWLHQWFSHLRYVNMQQFPCICECRWTSELMSCLVWGRWGVQTCSDRLLLLRWVFPVQRIWLCVLYKVTESSCRYSESPEPDKGKAEKPFQLTRKCPRMRLSGVPIKLWTHKSLCFTRGHPDSRRRWTVALRPHYDPNQFQNNACYITVMTLDCVIIPCRYVEAAEIYRIHKRVSSGKWLFFIISGTDLWTRV